MKARPHRPIASILLASAALFGLGCEKTQTPTEPHLTVSTPTPMPQPASLSGTLTYYPGTLVTATVLCQGKSMTASADGKYSLSDLATGNSLVTVTFTGSYGTSTPVTASGENGTWIILKPGPNTLDFLLWE